ncbi:MAG: hypothetical protein FWC62_04880 [Firmicutes bacterium]|nr:hypothetical protein [Bacillota bacterium]
MREYKFNVTGTERKALVKAISEILNAPVTYLGMPSAAYEVGDYTVDSAGTVTGEYDLRLFVGLAERGFEPESSKTFHLITPRGTLLIQECFDTAAEAETAGYGNYFHHEGRDVYIKAAPNGMTEHSKWFAVVGAPFEETAPVETPEPETVSEPTGRLTIEVPALGFTPQHIENLNKMVLAKEALLKKALGVDELPIRMGLDTIQFSWFPAEPGENAAYYTQFIYALCETAKEKKRVTAKARDSFENEKFALRVFMIGLGLIGPEYGKIRRLMTANLNGNSSWRYGAPNKAEQVDAQEGADPAPEASEEVPAEEPAPAGAVETEAGTDE